MESKKNSKKKASNTTTPANQSVLAFNAMTPLMNSPLRGGAKFSALNEDLLDDLIACV